MSFQNCSECSRRVAVVNFPGYEVCACGNVWTKKKFISWRRLSPRVDDNGYHTVRLIRDKKRHWIRLAWLVLEAFSSVRPEGHESAHENGNPRDNRIENLRWSLHRDNIADKKRHGTHQAGVKHGMHKLTELAVKEIRAIAKRRLATQHQLATAYSVSWQTIQAVCQRRLWKHIP